MTGDSAAPGEAGATLTGAAVLPSLADAVRSALAETRHGWLQRVVVVSEGGRVVLQGKVPSYYLKQMAQTVALAVQGVEVLRNELQVEGGNL